MTTENDFDNLPDLDETPPTQEELDALEAEIQAEEQALAPDDQRALAAFENMRLKAIEHYDDALAKLPAPEQVDLTDPVQSLQVALRSIALGLKTISGG
jgi:hypothetical protein